MHIGYILTIIFAVIWIAIKIIEGVKKRKEEERAKEVIISSEKFDD